jgi:small GTP-binding protein
MGCQTSLPPEPVRTVTFVGLDGSGKSRIVSRILDPSSGNSYVSIPTAGVSYHQTHRHGLTICIFDCGGLGRYREQWLTFVEQSNAVVFVIDRTDTARMGRVREEIAQIIEKCHAARIPLLIVVNKCDLESRLEPPDILRITKVEDADIDFAIKQCSAVSGHGIESVADWIHDTAKSKVTEQRSPLATTGASAIAPPDDDSHTE